MYKIKNEAKTESAGGVEEPRLLPLPAACGGQTTPRLNEKINLITLE